MKEAVRRSYRLSDYSAWQKGRLIAKKAVGEFSWYERPCSVQIDETASRDQSMFLQPTSHHKPILQAMGQTAPAKYKHINPFCYSHWTKCPPPPQPPIS